MEKLDKIRTDLKEKLFKKRMESFPTYIDPKTSKPIKVR
jgi:hypothetical protein